MEELTRLISQLEDEIEDPDEETFLLYSNPIPSQNLGFIDVKATTLEVTVGEKDYTIHQSPGVLSSTRAGGTTGAVLWKVTPAFAEWISSPSNPFFHPTTSTTTNNNNNTANREINHASSTPSLLTTASSILELGCGISPLNALALSSKVGRYVLSDQIYVQKMLQLNLEENWSGSNPPPVSSSNPTSRKRSGGATTAAGANPKRGSTKSSSHSHPKQSTEIYFQALDWELDEITPSLFSSPSPASPSAPGQRESDASFDAVIACDCVFNYALIPPFTQTCADICALRLLPSRSASSPAGKKSNNDADEIKDVTPCLCIIAQQLRNDDVFKSWLSAFMERFRVWKIPGSMLPLNLRPEAGFVVHVGVLKEHFL